MDQTPLKNRIPYWLKFILLIFLLFLISLAILRTPIIPDHFPDLKSSQTIERKEFPSISLIDENGLKEYTSDFKGKVIIVSLWASWCAPCLDELPVFAKLQQQFPELKFLPINQDNDPTVKLFIDNFWRKNKIPFKTYYDPEQTAGVTLNVDMLPANFVLDKKGKLVFTSMGTNDWQDSHAINFIKQLVSE